MYNPVSNEFIDTINSYCSSSCKHNSLFKGITYTIHLYQLHVWPRNYFWPAKPKFRLTLLGLGQYCSCSLSEDYYTRYASWLVAAL